MSFYIVKGDILEREVDAIVVAIAPHLRLDEGHLQSKIKKICGKKLKYEMDQLKNINISECVIVNAYNLPCKKIIFAASPNEIDGQDEQENLESTYINCLDLAVAFELESIEFCLLSAGTYEMNKRKAIKTAVNTITNYLKDTDINVGLVIHEKDTFYNYRSLFKGYEIKPGTFADKEELEQMLNKRFMEQRRIQWYQKRTVEILENGPEAKKFKEKLELFMTQKGLSKFDCYNGAVSKTMFNSYLKGSAPKKYTAISIGINMGLNTWEIDDLLETINESLDERIEVDQIIINGVLGHKLLDDINRDLVLKGKSPLPTNKSAR